LIQQVKTVSKETIIYGLGSAASSIVSFFLIPLYTKFLSPEEYGYLAVLAVVQTLVEITAVFGLSSGLFRYFLMAENEEEKKTVLMTCVGMQAAAIVVVGALTLPFSSALSISLFGTESFSTNLAFASLTGLFAAFGNLFYSILRAEQKSVRFAVLQVIKIVLLASTNIYLVAVLHLNYSGIVLGNMLVFMVLSILVPLSFVQELKFTFSSRYVPKLLRFVYPIYLVNIFFYVVNLSDRFFLNHYTSPHEVGVYSLGYKIGTAVMALLISPFSTAIVPYALSIAKQENFRWAFAKIIKYFFLLAVYISLGIFLFSPEIIRVVSNPSYADASQVVGLILLSSLFYGLYYSVSIAIDIVEKTRLATVVVFCGAIVSLGLNFYAVPRIGMVGSAVASCVSNGVLLVLMYYVAQKNLPLQYEYTAFLKLIGIVTGCVVLYYAIGVWEANVWGRIGLKALVYALFPVSLVVVRVLDLDEREVIVKVFQRYLPIKKGTAER
jgi:O-antigen/teichoic acid export membrane protein